METMTPSAGDHRLVVPEFLTREQCQELLFIHKSCGVVGYRPRVLSTTLSHLIATNCANLIVPLLPIRERIKDAVEEYFNREYELFTEFTGLISWTKGSEIGWHSDDNRHYLKQRHYSAVCYLSEYERDFDGGLFHFQTGQPETIVPSIGTLIIYTADERNVHSVEKSLEVPDVSALCTQGLKITSGERCSLALWFTSDKCHDEDEKIIQQIVANIQSLEFSGKVNSFTGLFVVPHPLSASSVMYDLNETSHRDEPPKDLERSSEEAVTDLREIRVGRLGFHLSYPSAECGSKDDAPVEVHFGAKKVPSTFRNSLHALQVIQFHSYRRHEEETKKWKPSVTKDYQDEQRGELTPSGQFNPNFQPGTGREGMEEPDIEGFLKSCEEWKEYSLKLWHQLGTLLPRWKESRYLVT